jgi:hypothetical protein
LTPGAKTSGDVDENEKVPASVPGTKARQSEVNARPFAIALAVRAAVFGTDWVSSAVSAVPDNRFIEPTLEIIENACAATD